MGPGISRKGSGMLKDKKINCPKCQGTLFIRRDKYGPFVSCIQCGWCKDLPLGEKPSPKGEVTAQDSLPSVGDGCQVSPSCFTCPLPDCFWEAGTERAAYGRDREILAELAKHWHRGTSAAVEATAQTMGTTSRTVYRALKKWKKDFKRLEKD